MECESYIELIIWHEIFAWPEIMLLTLYWKLEILEKNLLKNLWHCEKKRLLSGIEKNCEIYWSNPAEVYLGRGILKICSTFVNLLRIFRTTFYKNSPGGLLLNWVTHDETKRAEFAITKFALFTLGKKILFIF